MHFNNNNEHNIIVNNPECSLSISISYHNRNNNSTVAMGYNRIG